MLEGFGAEHEIHRGIVDRPNIAFVVKRALDLIAEIFPGGGDVDADVAIARIHQSPVWLCAATDIQHRSMRLRKLGCQIPPDGAGLQIEKPAKGCGESREAGGRGGKKRWPPALGRAMDHILSAAQRIGHGWQYIRTEAGSR